MTHITNAIHRISRWLNRSLSEVLPISDELITVQVTDRDIAEDLAYGRD
jgi:hypothetical protein